MNSSLKTNQTSNEYKNSAKTCDFCHSEEGKIRLVGQFIVRLTNVYVYGEKKLACQSCLHKHEDIKRSRKEQKENEANQHFTFKGAVAKIIHASFLIALFSTLVIAQPPGMPGAPSQAPIDGGLSFLAAAGGIYALKKIRKRSGYSDPSK